MDCSPVSRAWQIPAHSFSPTSQVSGHVPGSHSTRGQQHQVDDRRSGRLALVKNLVKLRRDRHFHATAPGQRMNAPGGRNSLGNVDHVGEDLFEALAATDPLTDRAVPPYRL